jgi:FtsH-binding integral membrane protein
MFKIKDSFKDKLVLLLPVFWVLIIVMVYMEQGLYAMYVSIAIGAVSVILGLSEGEEMNKKLFVNLFIGWIVVMGVSVTGMIYYYLKFGNEAPTFTLLGMHPSGFFLIVGYWLANFLYLSLTLYRLKDIWLPQERWEAFEAYAKTLQKEKGV